MSSSSATDNGVWLFPADVATDGGVGWNGILLTSMLALFGSGVWVLARTHWRMYPNSIYYYVWISLTMEVICMALTGITLLAIKVVLGPYRLVHALGLISFCNELMLSVAYFFITGSGCYVLLAHEKELRLNPLLACYVVMTSGVCCAYSLRKLPTVVNLTKYALSSSPGLDGRTIERDDFYYAALLPVDEMAAFVAEMSDPIRP